MIELHPYSDHAANHVLSMLDPMDHIEAELVRGASASHLALFADWRSMEGMRVMSLVLCETRPQGATPFAVLALSNTGQAGVAQAAFLSRSHSRFRRSLLEAAQRIRQELPDFCAEHGIHRIEARSWADHPRAGRFLSFCGFYLETPMPGFGADGGVTFNQFAWICPTQQKENSDVL
jgi:hypothetical protein